MKRYNDSEFDLQLFANEDEDGNKGVKDEDLDDTEVDDDEKDTFTKEEYEAKLQSETDKRVTQALKKQERKLNDKLKEADKLRDMSDAEKKAYELDKREQELSDKEKEYSLIENKVECSNILIERELPSELSKFVVSGDADSMLKNINEIESIFKEAISQSVKDKMGKKTPFHKSDKDSGTITKEDFDKMTLTKQSELYREDIETWKRLAK